MDLEVLKYPVGHYKYPDSVDEELRNEWISTLESLPKKVKKLVENLSYDNLEWKYRPKGWSIKQVVHHLADSHMNSFIRFKLMLTEDIPTIKPYHEAKWAELADSNNPEIQSSIEILDGLHERLTTLLKSLKPKDWERKYFHPEYEKEYTLEWMLGMYAWHSNHHLAHIKQAIEKQGDFTWDD